MREIAAAGFGSPGASAGTASDQQAVTQRHWGELLATAQAGDADAYRLFLRSIVPFVQAVARHRTCSEDMAAAVVEDVLLTVHRVRHTYQPGLPVTPWLARIAVRRSLDARVGSPQVQQPAATATRMTAAA
jgi:DNA-directed RNA polymerase specialized sigma24 family protein